MASSDSKSLFVASSASSTSPSSSRSKKRILLFGTTGAGKSSVIQLVTGQYAPISHGAVSCTNAVREYEDDHFVMIDTPGLNGALTHDKSVEKLQKYLRTIPKTYLDLAVLVVRKDCLTFIKADYKVVSGVAEFKKIPLLVVVTGCEYDEPLQGWWTDYRSLISALLEREDLEGCCVCTIDAETIGRQRAGLREALRGTRALSKERLVKMLQ